MRSTAKAIPNDATTSRSGRWRSWSHPRGAFRCSICGSGLDLDVDLQVREGGRGRAVVEEHLHLDHARILARSGIGSDLVLLLDLGPDPLHPAGERFGHGRARHAGALA